MKSNNKVAAIIIAAGGSDRLGFPKQLLKWHGKTLIEFIISIAIRTHLSPILVVLGAYFNQIDKIISKYPILIIRNKEWEEGKASSIRKGIEALPNKTQAVILFVVDQPLLNDSLINALVRLSRHESSEIIAPRVEGIQCNPVLFKRSTFKHLLGLKGNDGGKTIFPYFQVKWVDWKDKKVLFDIDSKKDLTTLMKRD